MISNKTKFIYYSDKTFEICKRNTQCTFSENRCFKWFFISVSVNFHIQKWKTGLISYFKSKTHVRIFCFYKIRTWYLWSFPQTLREKVSSIQSEYRKIRTRKNSVFEHFSHSDNYLQLTYIVLIIDVSLLIIRSFSLF